LICTNTASFWKLPRKESHRGRSREAARANPHWVEHNEEHASELQRWAELATEASQDILAAAESMMRVNQALAMALEKLGGPTSSQHIQE
jgi:hypothetical protein